MLIASKVDVDFPKLLEFARGKDCTIRLPGICKPGRGTEVMSHPPKGSSIGRGWAIKPPDYLVAIACDSCHAVVDGRNILPAAGYLGDYWSFVEVCFWRGHAESLIMMVNDGLITI